MQDAEDQSETDAKRSTQGQRNTQREKQTASEREKQDNYKQTRLKCEEETRTKLTIRSFTDELSREGCAEFAVERVRSPAALRVPV